MARRLRPKSRSLAGPLALLVTAVLGLASIVMTGLQALSGRAAPIGVFAVCELLASIGLFLLARRRRSDVLTGIAGGLAFTSFVNGGCWMLNYA